MPKFNPNDYEMVEDRLKKFWKENPNGRVWTEVITVSEDGTMVVVKAMVYTDKEDTNPVSTGIAQELKGQGGFANADAWMENCETSAIGRALAKWKYQGSNKKRPSAEEMAKVAKGITPSRDWIAEAKAAKSIDDLRKLYAEARQASVENATLATISDLAEAWTEKQSKSSSPT